MKRLLILNTALGLVAWGTSVANANDLFNADLDIIAIGPQNSATPVNWNINAAKTISNPGGGFTDGASSEGFCNVQQPNGYGLFLKPFQGNATAGDLLTVDFYQDNPSSPGTKATLSGYAAGEANYSGFFATNNPAPKTLFIVEFLDAGGNGLVTNEYDLVAAGLPSTGAGSMALFTTPQYTAPANTATVRVGVSMRNVYSTTGGQSFFVDAFDLETVAPAGSPVITNQPSQTTVSLGATAHFTVGVSNLAGATFQWQLYGTNLSNGGNISGATSQTLNIANVSASDIGHYRVRVSNGAGSVFSQTAPLAIVGINFYPVVTINGKIGDTYEVDYATALNPTTWIPLSTNLLTTSPQLVIDATSPGNNSRFYRAVFLY